MERALTRFRELQRDHPISYYASALDDYLAISGITLAPLKDDGSPQTWRFSDDVDHRWVVNFGFKSAAQASPDTLSRDCSHVSGSRS